jgi:hypothetical protein
MIEADRQAANARRETSSVWRLSNF